MLPVQEQIHGMLTGSVPLFRIWDSDMQYYVCKPMTAEELRFWMMMRDIVRSAERGLLRRKWNEDFRRALNVKSWREERGQRPSVIDEKAKRDWIGGWVVVEKACQNADGTYTLNLTIGPTDHLS